MDNLIIKDAINTGVRDGRYGLGRELILLYEDGTWEKIFKTKSHCNMCHMNVATLRGKTRREAIERLDKLCFEGKIEGDFLDYD